MSKKHFLTEILLAVCETYNVTPEQMLGRSRQRPITDARHLFCYATLIQTQYQFSLIDIGAFLGGRDHATVLASRAKAEELLEYNKPFQRALKRLASKYHLITHYMSNEERQVALDLLNTQITNLETWLVKNPLNPYHGKITGDLRDLKAEKEKLEAMQLKAA